MATARGLYGCVEICRELVNLPISYYKDFVSVGSGGNLIGGGVMLPWLIGLVELISIIKIYFGLSLKIPLKSEFFLINYKRLLFFMSSDNC